MKKRCRRCRKVLTLREELYNSLLEQFPVCDDCLQKEQEAFLYKGGGNDPSTAWGRMPSSKDEE